MVFMPGNTVMGCSYHNGLDKWGDKYIDAWYTQTFGGKAFVALWQTMRDHIKQKPAEWQLEDWVAEVKDLLDDRPSLHTRELLIERGFYGPWPKG